MKPFLFFLFLFTFSLHAKDLSWHNQRDNFIVDIHVNKSEIALNETLLVSIQLSYPDSYSISVSELTDSLLWHVNPLQPNWELKKKEIVKSQNGLNITFFLTPLHTGTLYLSFFNMIFHSTSPEKKEKILFPPPFEIIVLTPAYESIELDRLITLLPMQPQFPIDLSTINKEQLYHPTAIEKEAHRNQKLMKEHSFPWLIFFSLALSPLLVLLWRYFGPLELFPKPVKPGITAEEKAFSRLKIIQGQDLPKKGLFNEYFTILSETVRSYLEERFVLPVTAETTEEFLSVIALHPAFPKDTQELLKQFLTLADRVKFAHAEPTLEECQEAFEYARKLIPIN